MSAIHGLEKVFWGVTMLVTTALAVLVVKRKNNKAFPVFFAYLVAVLTQNLIFVLIYWRWGIKSPIAAQIGWGAQWFVVLFRSLAVAEICRRVLARYRGIWALAWRLLAGAAALVLVYSGVAAGLQWQLALLNADRGLELTITTVLAVLFVFAHYYEVEMEPAARLMAIGFFLYSSFVVLNDTFLEHWRFGYEALWRFLGTLAYLASLTLWVCALREPQEERAPKPDLLSEIAYPALAPQINFRLRLLNEQLSQFWNAEAKRP